MNVIWHPISSNGDYDVFGAFSTEKKEELIQFVKNRYGKRAYHRDDEIIIEHTCSHEHDCCGCMFKQLLSFQSVGEYTAVIRHDYYNV